MISTTHSVASISKLIFVAWRLRLPSQSAQINEEYVHTTGLRNRQWEEPMAVLEKQQRAIATAPQRARLRKNVLQVVVGAVGCEARLHHLVLSRPASRGGHVGGDG